LKLRRERGRKMAKDQNQRLKKIFFEKFLKNFKKLTACLCGTFMLLAASMGPPAPVGFLIRIQQPQTK